MAKKISSLNSLGKVNPLSPMYPLTTSLFDGTLLSSVVTQWKGIRWKHNSQPNLEDVENILMVFLILGFMMSCHDLI